MSVDRQSIKNDLIAISNAISREESLGGIASELGIVIENIQELADEEFGARAQAEANDTHPEKDQSSGTSKG